MTLARHVMCDLLLYEASASAAMRSSTVLKLSRSSEKMTTCMALFSFPYNIIGAGGLSRRSQRIAQAAGADGHGVRAVASDDLSREGSNGSLV
jgi:hypothetical protein